MKTLYKTFRAELKEPDEDGSLNMFIPVSTASMDRDAEVIEPSAFKKTIHKFMEHPVLVASHDYRDLTSQIGEWTKLKITDTGIEGKPKYYAGMGNDQADWAFKLAQKGVAAFSIGFIPKEWEDGDGKKTPRRTYKEVELLEISQVIIPSNREAIMSMRTKSVDPVIAKICDEVEKSDLITKPEVTEEYVRIPVDTGNHEGHRIRTIDISAKEGVKAIYCGTDKVVMTYLFAKDKGWDMSKARAWVKEHAKNYVIGEVTITESDDISIIVVKIPDIPQIYKEAKTSQSEIIDEIDYLKVLIEKEGLGDKAIDSAKELIDFLHDKRISGSDMPVDIKATPPDSEENKVIRGLISPGDITEAIRRMAKI